MHIYSTRLLIYKLFSLFLVIILLFSIAAPVATAQDGRNIYLPSVSGKRSSSANSIAATNLLFRTRVTVKTAAQWRESWNVWVSSRWIKATTGPWCWSMISS